MRIGIVGTGSLGGSVGRLWVQAGHEVLFSSRNPDELVAMTRQLGPRASAGTSLQAAEFGAVVLFAVPHDALPQLGMSPIAPRSRSWSQPCKPTGAST
jgi:predicted dinucleotide-binding enzyme